MSTQLQVAFEVLAECEREIRQTDLLTEVSRRHGSSRESIRGSIIGDAPSKLMGKKEFKDKWVYCRKPTRFVRKEFAGRQDAYKTDYDTPSKKLARLRGFSELFRMYKPTVLTLASDTGHCVRQIREVFPEAQITNVERDRKILGKFQKLDMPTVNILSELKDFVENDSLDFDFLNLDLMGYMAGKNFRMFQEINAKTSAEAITVNLQHGYRIRNIGAFADMVRRTMAKDPDQIKTLMKRAFDNFDLVDCFSYTRDETQNCRMMRMFVFRRKKGK